MSYENISDETTADAIADEHAARAWRSVECPECGTVREYGHATGCPEAEDES